MALLAPMTSARVKMTAAVYPGDFKRRRSDRRNSRSQSMETLAFTRTHTILCNDSRTRNVHADTACNGRGTHHYIIGGWMCPGACGRERTPRPRLPSDVGTQEHPGSRFSGARFCSLSRCSGFGTSHRPGRTSWSKVRRSPASSICSHLEPRRTSKVRPTYCT